MKNAQKVGLSLNIKKTKSMAIGTDKKLDMKIGNTVIEHVEEFVYLGHKITSKTTKKNPYRTELD